MIEDRPSDVDMGTNFSEVRRSKTGKMMKNLNFLFPGYDTRLSVLRIPFLE